MGTFQYSKDNGPYSYEVRIVVESPYDDILPQDIANAFMSTVMTIKGVEIVDYIDKSEEYVNGNQ